MANADSLAAILQSQKDKKTLFEAEMAEKRNAFEEKMKADKLSFDEKIKTDKDALETSKKDQKQIPQITLFFQGHFNNPGESCPLF